MGSDHMAHVFFFCFVGGVCASEMTERGTWTRARSAWVDGSVGHAMSDSFLRAVADRYNTRPVIFLDIDGVLNRTVHATHIRLDDDLVERLRALVVETEAVIVLSTFWRFFVEYIRYILHRHGVPADAIISRTPGVSEASSWSNAGTSSTTVDACSTCSRHAPRSSSHDDVKSCRGRCASRCCNT